MYNDALHYDTVTLDQSKYDTMLRIPEETPYFLIEVACVQVASKVKILVGPIRELEAA